VAIASGVRLLPLALDDAVSWSTALVFAEILTVPGSQTVLLVALPTGFAIAAADLGASGEARALAAMGASPWRLARATWPTLVLLTTMPIVLSFWLGEQARSPGMLAARLLARATAACGPARPISRVPWVSAVVLCDGTARGLAVGSPSVLLRAEQVALAPDLSGARLGEARVELRGPPLITLRTPELSIRGAAPFALPVSAESDWRSVAVVFAAVCGGLAAFVSLLRARETRRSVALLVSGSVPALALLAGLDARKASAIWLSAVPLIAVAPALGLVIVRGHFERRRAASGLAGDN
jgi:hypothetical protein